MFKQIAQAGCHDHQQQHDESRGRHDRPLTCHHFRERLGGTCIACELEQAQQAEDPQETQVEQVVQENFQEKRCNGQQVDDGRC